MLIWKDSKFVPMRAVRGRCGKTQVKSWVPVKSLIVIFTFAGRRWDATSLIPSTQPLSKPAICFDWHSFVPERRQSADSWWCKRRARNTFLSAAEEETILHGCLQKRLGNSKLIWFIESDCVYMTLTLRLRCCGWFLQGRSPTRGRFFFLKSAVWMT